MQKTRYVSNLLYTIYCDVTDKTYHVNKGKDEMLQILLGLKYLPDFLHNFFLNFLRNARKGYCSLFISHSFIEIQGRPLVSLFSLALLYSFLHQMLDKREKYFHSGIQLKFITAPFLNVNVGEVQILLLSMASRSCTYETRSHSVLVCNNNPSTIHLVATCYAYRRC